jgi:hypothetical protein
VTIGRAPIYPPGYPIDAPMQPSYAPVPAPWPAAVPQWQGAPQPARQEAAPRPIFRGQAPDEVPPPVHAAATSSYDLMVMPTPNQLGINNTASSAEVDWADCHRRLQRAGALAFTFEQRPQGGCRMICLLATGQERRQHRIEVSGATEMEVVQLAMAKSEEWAKGR